MEDQTSTGMPEAAMSGDYVSRYAAIPDSQMHVIRQQERMQARMNARADRREAELRDDIDVSDPESVPGFVWSLPDHEVMLNSLVSRGRYAEAKQYYDGLMTVVDDNIDEIIPLTKVSELGPTGAAIAQNAARLLSADFEKTPVTLMDGSQVPIGSVLRGNGDIVRDTASDEFSKLGLGESVAAMYFDGTERQKRAIRSVVDPLVSMSRQGGVTAVPNHIQMAELADDVVNNWDQLESVFEDGAPEFVSYMQSLHEGTGGAANTMRALTSVAAGMADANGTRGKDLVRQVMSGYNGLAEAVFAPPDGQRTAPVSPNQRMTFDSMLTAGVAEASKRGVPVDLNSPQLRQAARDVMSCLAYAGAAGIDLFSEAHSAGRPLSNAFGDYIANAMTGVAQPSDNVINSFIGVQNILNESITGGRDFADAAMEISGNPADYLSSVARSNSGWSSSHEADGVALGVKQYLMRRLVPGIAAGKTPDDALREVSSGSPTAYLELLSGVSDIVGRSMIGPGAPAAAGMVAEKILDGVLNGRRVSVEDAVFELAFPSDGLPDDTDPPDEIKTLRNWYNGNVVKHSEFSEAISQCQNHLRNEGMNDIQVAEIMSKVNERAAHLERRGGNPMTAYDSILHTGHYLKPRYAVAPDGTTAVDDSGQPILEGVDSGIGNLDRVGYVLDGTVFPEGHYSEDRAGFEYGQNELRKKQEIQYRAEMAAARKQAVDEVTDD